VDATWLLRKWGYQPFVVRDRRNRPLRIKMQFISMEARLREYEVMQLRHQRLSFRAIGQQLGISHVAVQKRYWHAMQRYNTERIYRARCLGEIINRLNIWIKYFDQAAGSQYQRGNHCGVSHKSKNCGYTKPLAFCWDELLKALH
jgi:hypothetical protein